MQSEIKIPISMKKIPVTMKKTSDENKIKIPVTMKKTSDENMKILIDTGKSKLWVIENYTLDLYDQVKELPLLEEPEIKIFGKVGRQRRNVGFFSDQSSGYQYSGQTMKSQPLMGLPILQKILSDVNQTLETNFNGILVNQYINGEKYVGAHSDDERGLDKTGKNMVAGISYGAIRTFRIRNKQDNKIVLDYQHQPMTLIVMEGDFQKEFKHEIPIEKGVTTDRISLTFRSHSK
jgi:alkylated DNA repair dioxygenase AlkB